MVGEIGFDGRRAVADRHDGQDGLQFGRFKLKRIHVFLQGDGVVLRHHGEEIRLVKRLEFENRRGVDDFLFLRVIDLGEQRAGQNDREKEG